MLFCWFFLWCPQCVPLLKYFNIWDKPLIFTINCLSCSYIRLFALLTAITYHDYWSCKMCTMIMWMFTMITLSECYQLLNCIELHRIASNWIVLIVCYQHVSFLELYPDHVSKYESYRLLHERFTPLEVRVVWERTECSRACA